MSQHNERKTLISRLFYFEEKIMFIIDKIKIEDFDREREKKKTISVGE
jgi:hypothetical protein